MELKGNLMEAMRKLKENEMEHDTETKRTFYKRELNGNLTETERKLKGTLKEPLKEPLKGTKRELKTN